MVVKPTYAELEKRIHDLENECKRYQKTDYAEHGKAAGLVGGLADLPEQTQTEAALAASERKRVAEERERHRKLNRQRNPGCQRTTAGTRK